MRTFGSAVLACLALVACQVEEDAPRNVLFVSIDDLRPSLACYGAEGAKTPHLDRLASDGTRFDRAYCTMASCAPSRASVLTGCRPDTTGVRDLTTFYRKAMPDVVVLPELFREQGWFTASVGKVQHGPPTGPHAGKLDDPRAWSLPPWRPERWQTFYGSEEAQRLQRRLQEQAEREAEQNGTRVWAVPRGLSWDDPDLGDSELGDGMIADKAIELLRAHRDEPFFLAVGFLKPHMPYVAPKRYYDMHPLDSLPPLIEEESPNGAPEIALTDSIEVRAHYDVPREGSISAEKRRELVRAYFACVSYVDAQLGRVLAELDELGLRERTIIVVWGDHGWHLGEQGLFGKHTNYESAVRAPLIVSVPGLEQVNATSSFVELIDLYPTLAELCGLQTPDTIEGVSFTGLLSDGGATTKSEVFHRYSRSVPGKKAKVEGYAVRTEGHRYVEWRYPNGNVDRELYDLVQDPRELVNIAPSEPNLVESLRAKL